MSEFKVLSVDEAVVEIESATLRRIAVNEILNGRNVWYCGNGEAETIITTGTRALQVRRASAGGGPIREGAWDRKTKSLVVMMPVHYSIYGNPITPGGDRD